VSVSSVGRCDPATSSNSKPLAAAASEEQTLRDDKTPWDDKMPWRQEIQAISAMFDRRPFTEGWLEVEDLRLSYEVHGTGSRVLVFLHGLLLDAQMNRRLADDLAERGHQVILLDMPGHGRSDKPRQAWAHRIDSYAHYVVALLDELGLDEAVVGGVSLGANVSLQVAVQAPTRVRGLLIEMPVLESAVPATALIFVPLLLGLHCTAPLARLLSNVARRIPRTRIGVLDSYVGAATLEPEEAVAVLHGMLVGPIAPTYDERRAIEAPALVIGHKVDVVHPFTDANHLARQLPHARLLEARSMLELRAMPGRLTDHIAGFLDEVWSPPPLSQGPSARAQAHGV
jgi:pimeloyl-ACP methyl ester carboxylesterase